MGKCFICHRCLPTEVHHIFGASNRKNSTRYRLTVDLCAECHRTGRNAVHRNKETMQWLHEYGQKKAMRENGWSIEDFRKVFHANYLDEKENDNDTEGSCFEVHREIRLDNSDASVRRLGNNQVVNEDK